MTCSQRSGGHEVPCSPDYDPDYKPVRATERIDRPWWYIDPCSQLAAEIEEGRRIL
jgi:hypothetical protein